MFAYLNLIILEYPFRPAASGGQGLRVTSGRPPVAVAAARGGEPFTSRSSDVARPAPGSHDHVLGLLSPGRGISMIAMRGTLLPPPSIFFSPPCFK